jgi:hypothetical protein
LLRVVESGACALFFGARAAKRRAGAVDRSLGFGTSARIEQGRRRWAHASDDIAVCDAVAMLELDSHHPACHRGRDHKSIADTGHALLFDGYCKCAARDVSDPDLDGTWPERQRQQTTDDDRCGQDTPIGKNTDHRINL